MTKALFIIEDRVRWRVFPDDLLDAFCRSMSSLWRRRIPGRKSPPIPRCCSDAEILITTWGCPRLDAAFLDDAPNLRAVFYAAGSVKIFVTDALWARGIRLTHAADGIAQGVVDFVLAQIILSLKGMWSEVARVKRQKRFRPKDYAYPGVRKCDRGHHRLGRGWAHAHPAFAAAWAPHTGA